MKILEYFTYLGTKKKLHYLFTTVEKIISLQKFDIIIKYSKRTEQHVQQKLLAAATVDYFNPFTLSTYCLAKFAKGSTKCLEWLRKIEALKAVKKYNILCCVCACVCGSLFSYICRDNF